MVGVGSDPIRGQREIVEDCCQHSLPVPARKRDAAIFEDRQQHVEGMFGLELFCTITGVGHQIEQRDKMPAHGLRSEENTSEIQSLLRTPYAVFCLKKNKNLH